MKILLCMTLIYIISTVTINAAVLSLRGQYSTATLIMVASTTGGVWDLVGDLNNS